MKKISHWGKPVALLALILSVVADLKATAVTNTTSAPIISESEPTLSQQSDNLQLAQGLAGQCRIAAQSMFVYRERSISNPIRALELNEQVTLAEENGRDGWIAVSSPIRGFVEARALKSCNQQPRDSREPISQQPRESREPRQVQVPPRSSPSNLCRRVTYEGTEGLAIRERPEINATRVSGVFLGERVTLTNPPQFRVDTEGREWVRLTAPSAGWMSNGFPSSGDLNLEACL
jgi:hypothetical protein